MIKWKCTKKNIFIELKFGRSDIVITSNSNENNDNWSNLGHSYKHPVHLYDSNEAKSFLAGAFYFKTSQIEVFVLE
jgi:hypothetical protein